jgi:hypothetical protein
MNEPQHPDTPPGASGLARSPWAGRVRLALLPLALGLLVLVAYRNAPTNGFHFDDYPSIVDHEPVHVTDASLPSLLAAARAGFLPRRPLPTLTFAFDWHRGGGQPRPFQVTNIAIHLATTLAVFSLLLLVLRSTGPRPGSGALTAALVGAALWAAHPIQVQSVTYIVQRMTSLAALFTIVSAVCYLLARRDGRIRGGWLGLAVATFMLGAVSKEVAWIAPFLWLLVEFGVVRHGQPLRRSRWDWGWAALPFAAVLFLLLDPLIGFGFWSKVLSGYDLRDFTLMERLLTQPRVVAYHISQLLWPLPARFSLLHEVPVSTSLLTPATTLPALGAVLAWCAGGFWCLLTPSRRVVGFFLLWLPVTLAIESTVWPLRLMFEHRLYLPSVGIAGLVAIGLARLLEGARRPVWLATGIGSAVLVALLANAASARVSIWRDDFTLWGDVVAKYPCSADAHNNLGQAHWRSGRLPEATGHYQAAVQCKPTHAEALLNLARSLRQLDRQREAFEIYQRLLVIAPQWPNVNFSLGMMYLEAGDLARARVAFETTLRLKPDYPQASMFLSYVSRQ